MTIADIAGLCRAYLAARERLAQTTEQIRALQRQALRSRLRALRSRAAEVSAARCELQAAVKANPQLFAGPRTRAFEGVKVGYRKRPGRIECDEARAIARIRKLYPDRETDLVRVRENLDRAALKRLDSKILAAIGVAVVAVDDEIVIAAAGGDLDKLVDAMLADLDGEEKEQS